MNYLPNTAEKYFKRKTKKKTQKRSTSIFHLQQSEQANSAKKDLLYHNFVNQKLFFQQKVSKVYKSLRQFSNAFDSWYGEKITMQGTDKQQPRNNNQIQSEHKSVSKQKQEMGQSQSKRRCHSTYSTYWNYKYMNKSADLNKTNVKKDKIAKNSQKKVIQTLGHGLLSFDNNKSFNINIVPKFQISVSSFKQIKQPSFFNFRQKNNKTPSIDLKNSYMNHNYIHSQNLSPNMNSNIHRHKTSNSVDYISSESIKIVNDEQNQLQPTKRQLKMQNEIQQMKSFNHSRGILGSKVKKRNYKRPNWTYKDNEILQNSNISSKFSNINDFHTTNSPLKNQIKKIINLLNEEDSLNHVLHNS